MTLTKYLGFDQVKDWFDRTKCGLDQDNCGCDQLQTGCVRTPGTRKIKGLAQRRMFTTRTFLAAEHTWKGYKRAGQGARRHIDGHCCETILVVTKLVPLLRELDPCQASSSQPTGQEERLNPLEKNVRTCLTCCPLTSLFPWAPSCHHRVAEGVSAARMSMRWAVPAGAS